MRHIADFHIHSKYSRACSPDLTLEKIAAWAQIKGINVISCADFTHPAWFKEISTKLEEALPGLYRLKEPYLLESNAYLRSLSTIQRPQYFLLATEISCIYSKNGKVRRVHMLVFAPSIEVVEKINRKLAEIGNIHSDGRPILGLDAKELVRLVLEISQECFVVPAHAWTPWFAVFGSKSGFDSLEECFDELTPYISAIETGLSSDPIMNWQLSKLDSITLISNSDAHSLEKLGREATVFVGDTLSYSSLVDAIRAGKKGTNNLCLESTIEFYPEEGLYHIDGHRACKFSCEPEMTKKLNGNCPVCKHPLTVGVLNRVSELADRTREQAKCQPRAGYKNIIPLQELIAQCVGVKSAKSKKVQSMYFELINSLGSEFEILLGDVDEKKNSCVSEELAQGLRNMREGTVEARPGYDGVYGSVRACFAKKKIQESLLH